MAKQINFDYEGKHYCLEFTRNSITTLEKRGFVIDDIDRKPVTVLPALFAGAFLAHHPWVKKEIIDKIFEKMPNKNELFGKLAEMYNEPLETLMDGPEETEGNMTWDANW